MDSNAIIIFIDFNYCGSSKAILVADYFPGKIRPTHFVIASFNAPTLPPPSVLIGINKSLFLIVKLFNKLIDLILRQVVFLIHLVLQHIL